MENPIKMDDLGKPLFLETLNLFKRHGPVKLDHFPKHSGWKQKNIWNHHPAFFSRWILIGTTKKEMIFLEEILHQIPVLKIRKL